MDTVLIEIKTNGLQEAFELLCGIPFEQATPHDSEPPTERQHVIQSIIDQMIPHIEDCSLENKLKRFIYKYDHEYDKAIDMSPHRIQQSTKKLVIDDLKTLLED